MTTGKGIDRRAGERRAPGQSTAGLKPRRRATDRMGKLGLVGVAVVLGLYAVYVVLRLEDLSAPPPAFGDAAAEAQLLATRLDGEAAALDAALSAAGTMAQRLPQSPVDAAEAGLAASGGSARAIAVVGPEAVRAQTSTPAGADWAAAAAQGRASGRRFWIGRASSGEGPVYAVRTLEGLAIVATVDLAKLLPDRGREGYFAITDTDGRIVAARTADQAAAAAPNISAALQIQPRTAEAPVAAEGRLASGAAMDTAQATARSAGLIAVAAQPAGATAAIARPQQESLIFLFAPLIVGISISLLLVMQIRRANEAMQAHQDTEQRFRLAVEAARCGIWEWDLKADTVMMSDVTGVILGWGGGGVAAGQEVLARIAPDHRERVRAALVAAREHGAFDVSFRAPKADGRSIWVDARGQAAPGQTKGEYVRLVGVAMDVTEERFAQARAQAAENRLRDAIESVSEAFALWDRQGRLLMSNTNFRTFFNLEPRLLKPGAPRDGLERFMRLAIEREEPSPDGRQGVREALLNDGRWVQISERRTAEGGMVVTAADISAIKTQDEMRRKNQEELQKLVEELRFSETQLAELARKYEAEKIKAEGANTAKSEFLANMSHELRTPLNAINGFSEIMLGEMFGPLGDARYKEYSRDILSSGQHLLALINDILDMSKIEAGKMTLRFEPLQVAEIVEDAVRLMRNRAETAGLSLVVDLPALPDVDADYRALKQVLLNLLSNAVKFTPRGGAVTVSAVVETNAIAERLKISVTDTGIGIAPDDLSRLARPFEQIETQHSKTQQGTGLGLALSKSLVEMHDGFLDMSSVPGEGTTVSFAIPVRQEGAGRSAA